ncbi:recombinase family protein [Streptomyces sp. NPDC004059]
MFNNSGRPTTLRHRFLYSAAHDDSAEWADADSPLETFPASPSGARVGYGRVSTKGQLLDRQISALEAAGCVRVFTDKKSGKNAEREELWKCLDYLVPLEKSSPQVTRRICTR